MPQALYCCVSMRVIEPHQLSKPPKKRFLTRGVALFFVLVICIGYGVAAYAKPSPVISPIKANITLPTFEQPALAWPNGGQAAFGAVDYGILGESGAQTAAPMASIAKVMTALAVVNQKPLKPGEQGPMITIGTSDVQAYNDYVQQNGSVVPVNLGETISEYQALQALLLSSANNMAVTLARWAFGSTDAYNTYANHLAESLNLKQTHITDPSGFMPQTVSTPHDLVLLGQAALAQPMIAVIVQQKEATIPVAGQIHNLNTLIGQNGINGIKTGNTTEAGGCFLFSSKQAYPNGQQVTFVGAIMGSPDLKTSLHASEVLLRSMVSGFHAAKVLSQGQLIGYYKVPWQNQASVVVHQDVTMLLWAGNTPAVKTDLRTLRAPVLSGSEVGQITIESGINKKQPLYLNGPIQSSDVLWRLKHLFVM